MLASFAAAVPPGGTIVEIGTAEGATAKLMRDAAAAGVEIYTVDIAPSRIAREWLAGSGVHVIGRPSTEFARDWTGSVGRPVDFLFIDGNHDLEHVAGDWNSWAPLVRPGGRVAFHDFDPPHRGGLAHFAVRVCGETVRRLARLRDIAHEYKMLHGRIDAPATAPISAPDCRDTLIAIADDVRRVLGGAQAVAIGDDPRLAALLRVALGTSTPHDGTGVILDSLTLCHLAEQALRRDYPGLAELPSSHAEFLVWGETLQMLDHGWQGPRFPESVPGERASLSELSSYVAREQVRLAVLSRLTALLVDRNL